jgi:hypothetical protein
MNVFVSAYLDGVVICLIVCGVFAGVAEVTLGDNRPFYETYKEVVCFALGWPAVFSGLLGYHLAKVWATRKRRAPASR